jgi:transcription elongation factor GreA
MNALPSDPSGIQVTEAGRRLLMEQLHDLEERLGQLSAELEDPERSVEVIEAYQRAVGELAELRGVLERAVPLDEVPSDPQVVELGDTVVIELEDGVEEAYVIVHAVEAAGDERRISVESPLAQALLHRRVGDQITVSAPSGSYRCTIRQATRS